MMTWEELMKKWRSLYYKSLQAYEYGLVAMLLGDEETAEEWLLTYKLCNENMDVLNEEMDALERA